MTNYKELLLISKSFFEGISYRITILSNASALLNQYLEDINWVGFYLYQDGKLILGPFQGLNACMEIPVGKGVCGTCAKTLEPQLVKDVHQFKGHIACDSRSNSELVLPIFIDSKLYGLLDIDSTSFNRFQEEDLNQLSIFLDYLMTNLSNAK